MLNKVSILDEFPKIMMQKKKKKELQREEWDVMRIEKSDNQMSTVGRKENFEQSQQSKSHCLINNCKHNYYTIAYS